MAAAPEPEVIPPELLQDWSPKWSDFRKKGFNFVQRVIVQQVAGEEVTSEVEKIVMACDFCPSSRPFIQLEKNLDLFQLDRHIGCKKHQRNVERNPGGIRTPPVLRNTATTRYIRGPLLIAAHLKKKDEERLAEIMEGQGLGVQQMKAVKVHVEELSGKLSKGLETMQKGLEAQQKRLDTVLASAALVKTEMEKNQEEGSSGSGLMKLVEDVFTNMERLQSATDILKDDVERVKFRLDFQPNLNSTSFPSPVLPLPTNRFRPSVANPSGPEENGGAPSPANYPACLSVEGREVVAQATYCVRREVVAEATYCVQRRDMNEAEEDEEVNNAGVEPEGDGGEGAAAAVHSDSGAEPEVESEEETSDEEAEDDDKEEGGAEEENN